MPTLDLRIVNVRRLSLDYETAMEYIYVGRYMPGLFKGSDFGNPFSHQSRAKGTIKVATAAEAVGHFRRWLDGDPAFAGVEPERRQRLLDRLPWLAERVRENLVKCLEIRGFGVDIWQEFRYVVWADAECIRLRADHFTTATLVRGRAMPTKSTPARFDDQSDDETQRMRSMPLVDYVQWMLDHGRYDIDPETGVVTNPRTGRKLKWIKGKDGYPYVELTFSGAVQRPIRIHRFIAVKLFGADAVKGMQVAHLDSIRHHSFAANLALMTPMEHVRFDGVNNLPRALPKSSWAPCVRCGDPDGRINKRRVTPTRVSGARFGIDGSVCARCYKKLVYDLSKGRSGA